MPSEAAEIAATEVAERWEQALDAMAAHVEAIRAGLLGDAPVPEPYSVRIPAFALPRHLLPRARLVLAEQRDIEIVLRERVGILGSAINQGPERPRSMLSLYIDRTA